MGVTTQCLPVSAILSAEGLQRKLQRHFIFNLTTSCNHISTNFSNEKLKAGGQYWRITPMTGYFITETHTCLIKNMNTNFKTGSIWHSATKCIYQENTGMDLITYFEQHTESS